jgi:hypothetical protein
MDPYFDVLKGELKIKEDTSEESKDSEEEEEEDEDEESKPKTSINE